MTSKMNQQVTRKPQDLVVVLKPAVARDQPFTHASLAGELGMSAYEVHASAQRDQGLYEVLSLFDALRVGALLAFLTIASPAIAASTCFGTVSNGRLEGGVAMPKRGSNFEPYADLAVTLGRTYVHASVEAIVVDAYARVAKSRPDLRFVYGETGWKNGGRFKPHRTHQNGTSVDFMVPVRNGKGESIPLPRAMRNRFGYDLEFNRVGRLGHLQIDFEAVAEHLYELSQAARARRLDLALVIFDPQYLPNLYATRRGAYLRQNIRFMKGKPWVRHDDHYHVDFAVKCRDWGLSSHTSTGRTTRSAFAATDSRPCFTNRPPAHPCDDPSRRGRHR